MWHAQITKKGKRYQLGFFDKEEEAALAYDAAATELHGDYARLNFPPRKQDSLELSLHNWPGPTIFYN
jgi:hypothetical protein